MSRIIKPDMGIVPPIEIKITFQPGTGNANCTVSREMPLAVMVQIFCNVLAQYAQMALAGSISGGQQPVGSGGQDNGEPKGNV